MRFEADQLVRYDDWTQLKSSIDRIFRSDEQWIFRGEQLDPDDRIGSQNGLELPLRSSFDSRWDDLCSDGSGNRKDTAERYLYESHLLREFKRAAHHYYWKGLPDKADFLQWLALARHYGMPCRLVDFTYSLWVAAYFACFEKRKTKYGVIVAINGSALSAQFRKSIMENDPEFLTNDVDDKVLQEFEKRDSSRDFHYPKLFWRYALKRYEAGKKDDRFPIFHVNPGRMNERLIAQQGLFLCQANIDQTFDAAFADLARRLGTGQVRAIVLDPAWTSEVIRDLARMNIKGSVLFPDLQGLGESLAGLFCRPIERGSSLESELKVAISEEPRW